MELFVILAYGFACFFSGIWIASLLRSRDEGR